MMYFKLRVNNCQPKLVYPAKLSSKINEELKTFQDKHKLKLFITTKQALEKICNRQLTITRTWGRIIS
jgi:hypothetical protein